MSLKLFHRTYSQDADSILQSGFKDGTGNYMTAHKYSGVWLSKVPLDANEGAFGDTLLEVELELSEEALRQFEWFEEGKGFREFLIPAALINAKAKVRVIED
jgi:hypothetical protein